MTAADVITALALPPESRVDRRVPKRLLVEHGAPTAADKRQINEGIEELLWVAALKPTTIGVPQYRDAMREALEIAVLLLALRPEAKAGRLVELVHRAIPYPVFLITEQANTVSLSLATKRLAQNEAGRVVLDEAPVTCSLDATTQSAAAWLAGLSLTAQPRVHLLGLYHGWIARLEALLAAKITGKVAVAADPPAREVRRQALADHARLQRDIAALRAQAKKEKQVNRRVELNMELKRLEAQLAEAAANL
jgi:Domain of unknown function (DUF4391)